MYMYVYKCNLICIYVHVYTVYVCTNVCIYVCKYACIYVHVCKCMYMHKFIHVYTCIHT